MSARNILIALVFINLVAYPAKGQNEEILLTRNGKPEATIVVPDNLLAACDARGNGTLIQMTAAEELQKYIEKASGAKLPIVPAAKAPAKGTLILIGRSSISDACKLKLPTKPGAAPS